MLNSEIFEILLRQPVALGRSVKWIVFMSKHCRNIYETTSRRRETTLATYRARSGQMNGANGTTAFCEFTVLNP